MKPLLPKTNRSVLSKINLLNCLAILSLSLVCSCEYQLNSEHFVDVSQPDSLSPFTIHLSLDESDYTIVSSVGIAYKLDLAGKTFYKIQFFLDNDCIYQSNENEPYFNFFPANYSIGYHTLTCVVTTNSNTNSLADLLKYENLTFKHEWKIYTDGQAPPAPAIKQVKIHNGVLRLEWDKYSRKNFQKYVVYRTRKDVDYNSRIQVAVITDSLQSFWEDYSYLGGDNDYWISNVGSNQEIISEKYAVSYPYPQLDTLWTKADSACFIWDKCLFYSALKNLKVQTDGIQFAQYETLYTGTDNNDTSAVIHNLRFGDFIRYYLRLFPVDDKVFIEAGSKTNSSSLKFAIGQKFPPFSKLYSAGSSSYLLLEKNDSLYKVDLPSNTLTTQKLADPFGIFSVMPDNQRFFLNAPYAIDAYDMETFQLIDSKNTNGYSFCSSSFSDQDLVFAQKWLTVCLLDFNKMDIIIPNLNYDLCPLDISPDGKFAFQNERIYSVSNSDVVFYTNLPSKNYYKIMWIPGPSPRLLCLADNSNRTNFNLLLFDVITKTVIFEKQIPFGYFCNLDNSEHTLSLTDNIGVGYLNKLIVIDYLTGNILRQLNIAVNCESIQYLDGTAYSPYGFSLKISTK